MSAPAERLLTVGVFALLGVGGYALYRAFNGISEKPRESGESVGKFGAGVVTGAAQGAGAAIGLPIPSVDKCESCIRAGDRFGASMHCDAATFLRYVASGQAAALRHVESLKPAARTAAKPGARVEYVTRN